jgi:hypothetical protein
VSALLLHLSRPHPSVPSPLTLQLPLKGALLISPWVSFETSSPSFFDNTESDYLTVTSLDRASSAFIGPGNNHDHYSEPVRAPPDWWEDVAGRVIDEILVWGGGGEVLIDGIRTFATTIAEGFAEADAVYAATKPFENDANGYSGKLPRRIGKDRVCYVETPREAHEVVIMPYNIPLKEKSGAEKVIQRWLNARLKDNPTVPQQAEDSKGGE